LAGTAGRSAATLQGQIGQSGLEGYLQGADLANRLQISQQQALMSNAIGTGTQGGGVLGGVTDKLTNSVGGLLSSLFTPSSSSQGINNVGEYLANYVAPSNSMLGMITGTNVNNMGDYLSQLTVPSSSMLGVTAGSGSFSDFDGDGVDDEIDAYPYDPTRG
jgi:hypothetical protein